MGARPHGQGVTEVVVGLALLTLLAAWTAPALFTWSERRAVWEEATRLAMQIQGLRAAAALDGRSRGVVFHATPAPGWTAVRDGDGDGISTADVRAGVDAVVAPRWPLPGSPRGLGWALPAEVAPVVGGSRPDGSVPFQPSGILAVSADGTASTGTAYLCARMTCAAVRMYGPGGRLSVWELQGGNWRQRW